MASWHPPKQSQSFGNDFQTAQVTPVWWRDIKVPHHHVRGHPGSALPKYLSDGTLCCETPPTQKPSCAARCAVVARSVEWTATPAGAYSERQGQTETAEQQDTEWLNPTWTRGGWASR